jgi:proteasome lid subunit RPN8/RPN11
LNLKIKQEVLKEIQSHGESSYPDEGAGLMLGPPSVEESRQVTEILPLANTWEADARSHRYSIAPMDLYNAEIEAEAKGLVLVGVFHSHPDHPAAPSEFDREHAMPWFSYIITSVVNGQATESRSWRLYDDRSRFVEEVISISTSDS